MFNWFVGNANGCWLWTGLHAKHGVGVVSVRRADGAFHATTVARRMWEILGREPPTYGGRITRTCRNGSCVNPDHLIGEQASDLWRVDDTTGCWMWLPRKLSVVVDGAARRAARIMWLRARGEILLPTATVENGCGRPRCVNPDHLYLESIDLWEEDPESGCWLWKHQLSSSGGGFAVNGQRWLAHRRMWFLIHGVDPREEIRHTCSVTRCVNPDHLTLGPAQNPEWFTVTDHGCWEWNGQRSRFGYGHIKFKGRMRFTHRLAWELYRGLIPQGLMVRHLVCDNPPCCNPDHLALGTGDDNIRDKQRKLRGGHKLTWEQVREIRTRRTETGDSYARIAADYGVDPTIILLVVRGARYVEPGTVGVSPQEHAARALTTLQAVYDLDTGISVSPDAVGEPFRGRFIVTDRGCWEWSGTRRSDGYGRVTVNSRDTLAHRAMWEEVHRKIIPSGLHVLHSCDNPPCVNPAHLKLGTPLQNTRDMSVKLRGHHKLTYDQADEIRGLRFERKTPFRTLAVTYGVTHKTIMRICRNEIYVR